MKKARKKVNKRRVPISLIALFLLLVYWVGLFYMTQPATDLNTSQLEEYIVDVEITYAYHRGTDKLYIYSGENCYMLDTGWSNEAKSNKLAEKLLSSEEKITVTFWEHFPNIFSSRTENFLSVKQVTDLRSDKSVYWNIENHNSYQQRGRIAGAIAGAFFSAFAFVVFYIELRMYVRSPLLVFKKYFRKEQKV